MGLFNRKKAQDSDAGDAGENKKDKNAWRRPASAYSELCGAFLTLPRYCLQAAATQGMAANSDAKDRPSDPVHHWALVRAYRRSTHLGIVASLRDDIRLHRLREAVTVAGQRQLCILTNSVEQILVSPQLVR